MTADGNTLTYTYNEAGELISQGEFKYSYDAAGNLTKKTGPQEESAFSYDAAGRLQEVAYPDGTGVSYTYDALGRKASRDEAYLAPEGKDYRLRSENTN